MTAYRKHPQADHRIAYILKTPPLPEDADQEASIRTYEEAVADEFMRNHRNADVIVSVYSDATGDGVNVISPKFDMSEAQRDVLAESALIARFDQHGNVVPPIDYNDKPDAKAILDKVLQRDDWVMKRG